MKIGGRETRTIVLAADGRAIDVLDQTRLPFEIVWERLERLEDVVDAIGTMIVRGAPLIGATAAFGMWLAMRQNPTDPALTAAATALVAARPTAVNLAWAVRRMVRVIAPLPLHLRAVEALREAKTIADADVAINRAIGVHGLPLLRAALGRTGGERPVRVLTHCNAGALATVDGGTALAPVYAAVAAGVPVEVVVDETRPRNQGASLTAFELREAGVPCVVVADNASGHLLQMGDIDLVLVGADRVAANGDVANKIGTYLKALAAMDARVPFYVACPLSTIDLAIRDGMLDIPIERRAEREVTHVWGRNEEGVVVEVQVVPDGVSASNPAFDVTPARLVTKLVTEFGVIDANEQAIAAVFVGPPS